MAQDGNPFRILLIDDEALLSENIKLLLEMEGYEVETASNGRRGIELLKAKTFNLVITDLVMPEVNGREVMDYIRSHAPQTLAIAITGYASIESAIESVQHGAFDYILKPFDFSILKISVKRAAERIELQKQLIEAHKLGAIVELAGGVAHELNQPLTVLLAHIQLLQKRTDPDGPEAESLAKMADEACRMANLIKKIGEITQYETMDYIKDQKILKIKP